MQLRIYQLKFKVFQNQNQSQSLKTHLFLFNQAPKYIIKEAEVEAKLNKSEMINQSSRIKFNRWSGRLKRRG